MIPEVNSSNILLEVVTIMVNIIKVKLILELRVAHVSQREIYRTRHISQHSVIDVFRIANEKGMNYENVRDKTDEEGCQMFFDGKFSTENLF